MPLQFTSLNSGSNGNCYYVGNATETVLIDAGLSCKETERRMARLGLSMKIVKAIFVSHEHIDHVRGLAGLADKYNMPVYVTLPTSKGCYHLHQKHIHNFVPHEPVHIGALSITAFPKFHDAADPHSFIVSSQNKTIGIFTDIGKPCKNLIHYFKQCHAAFLEANYDTNMLANGRYPAFLQQRISGGEGHLSNDEALEMVVQHKPIFMSHLLLAHLSKDNNDVALVQNMFKAVAGITKVFVASRYEEMELMELDELNFIQPRKKRIVLKENPAQMSLF
jgi:phosphoribosyl 1,2-cyclic phosphodiesterase